MTTSIQSLDIEGLYGKKNYLIHFDNNQLILVGENGSGKSTAITILYYLITSQWQNLAEYDFKSLLLVVNNKKFKIKKNQLLEYITRENEFSFSPGITKKVENNLNKLGMTASYALENLSVKLKVRLTEGRALPSHYMEQILNKIATKEKQSQLFDQPNSIIKQLELEIDLNVLFLPTYRRIERDLNSIFPDIDEEIEEYNFNHNNPENKKHVELVEFGMNDVKTMIHKKMKYLDANFRTSLDTLTGGYLRVILRKEYEHTDISILKEIYDTKDENILDDILQKIDKDVLSEDDRKTLQETIKKFSARDPETEIDKLSAHIITELLLLHKRQYEREEKVRTFASLCNKYLQNKVFYFDNNGFTLPILELAHDGEIIAELDLEMLSSGEKQIVSLFSHLYLSDKDQDNYFIIIDEPELSLSVPWQKTFLPDILASSRCNGLIAVTHSPFIYDNDLEEYAHAIQEFIKD